MDWIEIVKWITLGIQFFGLGVQIYFTRKTIKNYKMSEENYAKSLEWLRKAERTYKVTEVESDGD